MLNIFFNFSSSLRQQQAKIGNGKLIVEDTHIGKRREDETIYSND